jgi:predicted amidohydrolase
MPTRAFENGCYLLYANHSGTEGGLNYLGCSCIIGPDGRDLARASADGELLIGHLLLERVTAARIRLPYFRDLEDLKPRLASRLDQ